EQSEAHAARRAERRARNERLNRESAAANPAPRVPISVDPERGARSEGMVSILASRAGVPMDQLMRLGDDGRFVMDEEAIQRAEAQVFGPSEGGSEGASSP